MHNPQFKESTFPVSPNTPSLLCIGSVRNSNEIVLVLLTIIFCKYKGIDFVFAGKLSFGSVVNKAFITRAINKILALSVHFLMIVLNNKRVTGPISNKKLHSLVLQSDGLFVPRVTSLNSGIPYLAYSYSDL